jgi:hypothetical protein
MSLPYHLKAISIGVTAKPPGLIASSSPAQDRAIDEPPAEIGQWGET